LCGSIIIPSELLKVKVSQQFTFSGAAGCAVPSLSQVQVELLKVKYPNSSLLLAHGNRSIIIPSTSRIVESKVSQQFTFSGAAGCAVPSLSQVQVEVLKVKVSQQLLFFWCCRLCGTIIIPSTSKC
jgi:hypothetical protein